jgi:hypothetical protein
MFALLAYQLLARRGTSAHGADARRPDLLFCGALKRHGGFAMGNRILKFALAIIATSLSISPVLAQQSSCDGKQTNSSKIAADGTA